MGYIGACLFPESDVPALEVWILGSIEPALKNQIVFLQFWICSKICVCVGNEDGTLGGSSISIKGRYSIVDPDHVISFLHKKRKTPARPKMGMNLTHSF